MSQFECPVVRVTIEPHDNADSLEIARVGGFMSIVKKGQFKTDELAVYLPEQSVLPEWLLKHMGMWDEINGKGKLSGSAGNRIKAIKLRGVLSQGILVGGPQKSYGAVNPAHAMLPIHFISEHGTPAGSYDAHVCLSEGECAAEVMGVTKYEPKVPANMAGRIAGGDLDATIGYDFENIKKFPSLFEDGELVAMTEKIHGTFVQIGLIPEAIWSGKAWADKMADIMFGDLKYKAVVTSKGQGAKGLLLDTTDTGNLYVKIASELLLWNRLLTLRQELGLPNDKPIFLLGEIFGPGVQDGFTYGQGGHTFRAFDIYVGTRSDGYFVDYHAMIALCGDAGVDMVPLLYFGPFTAAALAMHTDGETRMTSSNPHMREGVVVKAVSEARHPRYGRKIAKSVSEAYLLRKGATTEFN
jgi:RNA ligase (TIGR02306 family)